MKVHRTNAICQWLLEYVMASLSIPDNFVAYFPLSLLGVTCDQYVMRKRQTVNADRATVTLRHATERSTACHHASRQAFHFIRDIPSVIIEGTQAYCGKPHQSRDECNIQYQSSMVLSPI